MINAYTIMMAVVVGAAYFMHGEKQFNKQYIIFSAVAMFILMGLRDAFSVGMDSASSYISIYNGIGAMSWKQVWAFDGGKNRGFYLLMKLVRFIFMGNYQWFIIIVALIVMVAVARFIYSYSVNPLQSVIYYWGLLIYTFQFSALKQAIAMAIILISFDMIVKKKWFFFVLLVFLASQFHQPAIVFLPAYWIVKIKIGRNYLLLLTGMLIFTYIFRSQLLELMNGVYETTINNYGMRFIGNKALIMIVIVAAALILRPPSDDEEDKIYCWLLSFVGIAIVFQTFVNYNNTFERLGDYYFQFAIVFIPMVFERRPLQRSYFENEAALNTIKQIAPVLFCGFGIWRMTNYIVNNAFMHFKFCF